MESSFESKKRPHLFFGVLGGLDAAIISAVLWALITVAIKYQMGYMAIAVGLVVGFSVRFFGHGESALYRFVSAIFALFGCLLGNYLSQVGFYLLEVDGSFLDHILDLRLKQIPVIMRESFQAIDVLYYAFAIWSAWKFSVKKDSVNKSVPQQADTADIIDLPQSYPIKKTILLSAPLALVIVFFGWVSLNSSAVVSDVYENGNKRYEGLTSWHEPHGMWTYWYESGSVEAQRLFKKGLREGLSFEYYENGQKKTELAWKAGLRNGIWKTWYEDGTVESEGLFVWDRRNGPWKDYHPNGQLSRSGNMKNDVQDGPWEEFDQDGQRIGLYTYDNGELSGEYMNWDHSGNLTMAFEYIDGEQRIFFQRNGAEILVEGGNGTFTEYYPNGNPRLMGPLVEGRKTGRWTRFHDDGSVSMVYEYVDGKELLVEFRDADDSATVSEGNGEIVIEIDGTVLYRASYVNGLLEGAREMFHENGQLSTSIIYSAGQRKGVYNEYALDGSLLVTGNYEGDKQQGQWEWYGQDGSMEIMMNYLDDLKHGEAHYWQYGEKTKTETWLAGELTKTVVYH